MVKNKKVLIVLTTGRVGFTNALDSLRRNIASYYNKNKEKDVDLVINFDPTYNNLKETDFLNKSVKSLTTNGKVIFAGPDFVDRADWLNSVEKSDIKKISPVSGYGQKKNICLLYAMRAHYDMVLFWDDDEFALHLEEDKKGDFSWEYTDIVGNHVNSPADITFGFWTGYVSPIPDDFFISFNSEIKHILTSSLQDVTDVVFPETFFDARAIYHAHNKKECVEKEILEENGGKLISGGNLGIHLTDAVFTKLPAFYTPTDSRGDDSILSLGINPLTVFQVNSGIYHDAFGLHQSSDFISKYNINMKKNMDVMACKKRFAGVLKGWLAYAPLLSYLRYGEKCNPYLNQAIEKLSFCDDVLMNYFENVWMWDKPSELLYFYSQKLSSELEAYIFTQNIWRKLLNETNK